MTRKDFQLIADVLKGHSDSPMNRCVIEQLALTFALELAKTNANFNKQRFINACMPAGRERAQLRNEAAGGAMGYIEARDLTPAEAENLR